MLLNISLHPSPSNPAIINTWSVVLTKKEVILSTESVSQAQAPWKRPHARIGEGIKFREELSPVCLREGKVSSLNLIFGRRSEQVVSRRGYLKAVRGERQKSEAIFWGTSPGANSRKPFFVNLDVGKLDLDLSLTDSEGLELVLHFRVGGDQGDQLILTCNSHLSESDRCEFK